VVGTAEPTASQEELASLMVGRAVTMRIDKTDATPGEVMLDVHDMTIIDTLGITQVRNLSFQVRAGEILAIAGVQGNGQTELTEAIMGVIPVTEGRVTLDGDDLTDDSIKDVLAAGVGFVPEDRTEDGVVAAFSIQNNMILDRFHSAPFSKGLALKPKAISENAERNVEQFDVRTTGIGATAGSLSGGNQQKVVLARELSRKLKLLIASQPTRGLDVGSIEFVHKRIVQERDAGAAVLIVSSELDEVVALADRIAVMYHGRIVGIVGPDTDRDTLGLMMAGALEEDAA